MNFEQIYKIINSMNINFGNVVVITPLEKFEMGLCGLEFTECEEHMSGCYPLQNKTECGGGEEIFCHNDYEGFIVNQDGSIIPAFLTHDGWQRDCPDIKTSTKGKPYISPIFNF